MLWLDNDREGENICFEVMSICQPVMVRENFKQVYRAVFSSLTKSDLRMAFKNLNKGPNHDESMAVDARQIIDLKVGVAFSRFSTLYFRRSYSGLKDQLITYGPCQTPTLAFCVMRKKEIDDFVPKIFFKCPGNIEINKQILKLSHSTERIWKKGEAENRQICIMRNPDGMLVEYKTKDSARTRPIGLNTVEMLKHGSAHLGMGPHDTMKVAERLYLSGYTTYPRTESTAYPKTFDFKSILKSVENNHFNSALKKYCHELMGLGINLPKKGVDQGDHPPITPTTKMPSFNDLSGAELHLYDFILRNFIGSLSYDAKFKKTNCVFMFGNEKFNLEGISPDYQGFLDVVNWGHTQTKTLPEMKLNMKVKLLSVDIEEGCTEAPDYLTESELIEKMEKFAIGTDASMATHINNICERNFVTVTGQKRRLVPSKLGIAMIESYNEIDKDLAASTLRSKIEGWVNDIATGKKSYEVVVRDAL